MLNDLLSSVNTIYIAYGVTDFRKQIDTLCIEVKNKFHLNSYDKAAFIFCNKKRNSIKVLCYDKNGFILAQKKLLDTEKMKFKWPRNSSEIKKAEYSIMLMDGTLNSHLKEIQETATERVEKIIKQLKFKSNLTEDTKNTDMLYWVGMMNNFKNQAEEIVFNELIYV